MSELTFTNNNFNTEVIQSKEPVLVDFWAPWCGPCRSMSPLIEELAKDLEKKKVKIGKLNIDEHGEIAGKFGIMSIPAIFIFKDGKIVEKLIGLQNKEELKKKIEEYL